MYWRWGVGECCLFYFPHWSVKTPRTSPYIFEQEKRVLQSHMRDAIIRGYNPHAPEYFLMVARGGWNALVLRRNHLQEAKFRIPVMIPGYSYIDEKELLEKQGTYYAVVKNLREAESVIFNYMNRKLIRTGSEEPLENNTSLPPLR